jgi:hypothetical protein
MIAAGGRMTAQGADRVWLNPPKFWAATKFMSREQADQLMNEIVRLAEDKNFEALQRFEFLSIGDPRQKQKLSS